MSYRYSATGSWAVVLSPETRAQIEIAAELAAAKFPPFTPEQIGRAAVILRAARAARLRAEDALVSGHRTACR